MADSLLENLASGSALDGTELLYAVQGSTDVKVTANQLKTLAQSGLTSASISDFTEASQDAIGAMVDSTIVYTDGTPLLSRAALTGDVTASAGSNATTITSDAVTFAKMQNITTDRLLGRDTASTGDVEELSVGGGIEFTGSGGIQTSAFTGDVTKSAGGTALTIGAGKVTNAMLAGSYCVARSAVAASVTGTVSETALANIALPAMEANDAILVETLWSYTNSANSKTPRVKLNTATGTGGTSFFAPGMTTNATMKGQTIIYNRNSVSSQVSAPAGAGIFGGYGQSSLAVTTGSINTGSTPFINITGQLANSGETLTLEAYAVHIWRA